MSTERAAAGIRAGDPMYGPAVRRKRDAEARFERAMVLLNLDRDAGAIADFEQVLKLVPEYLGARRWYAVAQAGGAGPCSRRKSRCRSSRRSPSSTGSRAGKPAFARNVPTPTSARPSRTADSHGVTSSGKPAPATARPPAASVARRNTVRRCRPGAW